MKNNSSFHVRGDDLRHLELMESLITCLARQIDASQALCLEFSKFQMIGFRRAFDSGQMAGNFINSSKLGEVREHTANYLDV